MSAFLVIDTETTGLPASFRFSAKPENISNWDSCRIVQIAWRVYDSTSCELLSSVSRVIKPEGFTIPDDASSIHGITTDFARQNGKKIIDALHELIESITRFEVERIVAHNTRFDVNVVLSELYRGELHDLAERWSSIRKYCTMLNNANKFGGSWPKLGALYTKVIGPISTGTKLHSADDDCRLCAEIYIKTRNDYKYDPYPRLP